MVNYSLLKLNSSSIFEEPTLPPHQGQVGYIKIIERRQKKL
jgi:hypothetical protein